MTKLLGVRDVAFIPFDAETEALLRMDKLKKTYYVDKTGAAYLMKQEWSTDVYPDQVDYWFVPVAKAHESDWLELESPIGEDQTGPMFEANIGRELTEQEAKQLLPEHLLDSNIA